MFLVDGIAMSSTPGIKVPPPIAMVSGSKCGFSVHSAKFPPTKEIFMSCTGTLVSNFLGMV